MPAEKRPIASKIKLSKRTPLLIPNIFVRQRTKEPKENRAKAHHIQKSWSIKCLNLIFKAYFGMNLFKLKIGIAFGLYLV
jgi:hypothetical protein